MKKYFASPVALCLSFILCLSCALPASAASPSFSVLTYPEEAITDFEPEMLKRISSGDDYLANKGYDETSLWLSPFWKMRVCGESVPVYAAPVYDWVLDCGVVQSFQYVFAESGAFPLSAELTFSDEISSVSVLPLSLNCKAEASGKTVRAEIGSTGEYTFLINGCSQEYAVTLFVKENADEDAEIAELQNRFGEENVQVFEKGVYSLDSLPTEKQAIYFKRGSFIKAEHTRDIRSDADAESTSLPQFAGFGGKNGAVVTGCGTIDFTALDRRERNLITVDYCRDSVFEGLILLNPNSWTLTAYACESCVFSGITVFGYRTNSDGINICGCRDCRVENCFARNGDDCFSVKTTNELYTCENIVFSGCKGWSCKARCFGITGEVFSDIKNITFTDCAVIYRNATWDNDRTASLAVSVETGGADIENILFKNIEIFRDTGRAILCLVYGEDIHGCEIKNIAFENITYSSFLPSKLSAERKITGFGEFCSAAVRFLKRIGAERSKVLSFLITLLEKSYDSSNSMSVSLKNVNANGRAVDPARLGKGFILQGNIITDGGNEQ